MRSCLYINPRLCDRLYRILFFANFPENVFFFFLLYYYGIQRRQQWRYIYCKRNSGGEDRKREHNIICQTTVCVCVCFTQAWLWGWGLGGDRYQNSYSEGSAGVVETTGGDVIGFRRGVLLIPGRNTRKSQPANSSRGVCVAGRGGFCCLSRACRMRVRSSFLFSPL